MPILHRSIVQFLSPRQMRTGAAFPNAASLYLEAQRALEATETQVIDQHEELAWRLLCADSLYQRVVAEARVHGACHALPSSLTGPVSVIQGVLAIRALAAALDSESHRSWSSELNVELRQAVQDLIDWPLPPDIVEAYRQARTRRTKLLAELLDLHLIPPEVLALRPSFTSGLGGSETLLRSAGDDWARAVVQIETEGIGAKVGSGVFLSPTHILTAAHVLENADSVRVTSPLLQMRFNVHRWRMHPGFDENRVRNDYAFITVDPVSDMGTRVWWDFAGNGGRFPVHRYGFPPEGKRYGRGSVTRLRRMFLSTNLEVPPGASGGGLFYESEGDVYLAGIATNEDPPSPMNESYVGLALVRDVLDEI